MWYRILVVTAHESLSVLIRLIQGGRIINTVSDPQYSSAGDVVWLLAGVDCVYRVWFRVSLVGGCGLLVLMARFSEHGQVARRLAAFWG